MTLHVESDADAFFRQGDEGTYAGGPADLFPGGMLDAAAEDPTPTPEQLKRRGRFKWLVAAIITALGAVAVVAVVVRIGGNEARRTASEILRALAPTKSEISSFAARVPTTQAEPVGATTPAEALTQKEAPGVELTTPPVVSVPVEEPAAESKDKAPARTARVPVARPSAGKVRVSSKPPRSVVPTPGSEGPRLLNASAIASGHGAPPTVVFPD